MSKKSFIIGISGHAGAGKNTIAEYLTDYKSSGLYARDWAFADAIKAGAAELFGVPQEDFYGAEKEIPYLTWGVSPRQIAQFVGTELFRDNIHKLLPDVGADFWIRRLENEIDSYGAKTAIITDVRFQNEINWIHSRGGIMVVVNRPGFEGEVGIARHASENQNLDFTERPAWYILNNGTKGELHAKVDEMLEKWINPNHVLFLANQLA